MRVVATGGIVGIATILGAALVSQDVAGWIVGLAVGVTFVTMAVLLWYRNALLRTPSPRSLLPGVRSHHAPLGTPHNGGWRPARSPRG
jgi:hypothetical protein